jgi:hypothetical protein
MANQIGKGHIFGFETGAFTCSTLSGYVSPKPETLRLTHTAEVERIKSQTTGNTDSLISHDEALECTFDVIAEGTSFANAKKSAGLPAPLSGFGITGLPIIEVGAWTDAFNVTTGGVLGNPWVYEGGGTINGFIDGKWTLSLPMKRYPGIANVTAIV